MASVFGLAWHVTRALPDLSSLHDAARELASSPSLCRRMHAWSRLTSLCSVRQLSGSGALPPVESMSVALLEAVLASMTVSSASPTDCDAAIDAACRIVSWLPSGLADEHVIKALGGSIACCHTDGVDVAAGSAAVTTSAPFRLCIDGLQASLRWHDSNPASPVDGALFQLVASLLRHGGGRPGLALSDAVQVRVLQWLLRVLEGGRVSEHVAAAALADLRAGVLRHLAFHPDEWAVASPSAPGEETDPWTIPSSAASLAVVACAAVGPQLWWWNPLAASLPTATASPTTASPPSQQSADSQADAVRFVTSLLRLLGGRLQEAVDDLVARVVGTKWSPLAADPTRPEFADALQRLARHCGRCHSAIAAQLHLFREAVDALLQRFDESHPAAIGEPLPIALLAGCRASVREVAVTLVSACAEVQVSPLWSSVVTVMQRWRGPVSDCVRSVDSLRACMLLPSLHEWLSCALQLVADDPAALGDEGMWPTLVHVALPFCAWQPAGAGPSDQSDLLQTWFHPACHAFRRHCVGDVTTVPQAPLPTGTDDSHDAQWPNLLCLLPPIAQALLSHGGVLVDPASAVARRYATDLVAIAAKWLHAFARATSLAIADARAAAAGPASVKHVEAAATMVGPLPFTLCLFVEPADVPPVVALLAVLDPLPPASATRAVVAGSGGWRSAVRALHSRLRDAVSVAQEALMEAGAHVVPSGDHSLDRGEWRRHVTAWRRSCEDTVVELEQWVTPV